MCFVKSQTCCSELIFNKPLTFQTCQAPKYLPFSVKSGKWILNPNLYPHFIHFPLCPFSTFPRLYLLHSLFLHLLSLVKTTIFEMSLTGRTLFLDSWRYHDNMSWYVNTIQNSSFERGKLSRQMGKYAINRIQLLPQKQREPQKDITVGKRYYTESKEQ